MLEHILFLIIFFSMGVYDIRKMTKANLKKEILPYLALMLLALTVAFIHLLNPLTPSLSEILLRLFGIKE
jgi:UDP-N-acetylmuramyl pentapeptide phosphotransferase/UDP-N-acetylglucosamine-1-phosphate transferase